MSNQVIFKVGGFADAQAARDAAAAAGAAGGGKVAVSRGRVASELNEADEADGGDGSGAGQPVRSHTACLQALMSFVGALTSKDKDGRILVARQVGPPPQCL